MRIIFFGTPPFAAKILDDLLQHGIDVAAVVTRQDKPRNRSKEPMPSAVKASIRAQRPDIPLLQPAKASSDEFFAQLSGFHADCFVVVAYGQILKKRVLDLPRFGCINVHASLLPKYRGAAPIQRCLMDGCEETGITIMKMDEGMDTGPMLEKRAMPIDPNMSYGQLQEALCDLAKAPLLHVLHALKAGTAVFHEQEHEQATYAPKVELIDAKVDFQRSALELHHLIRGTNPEPGAWCSVELRGKQTTLRLLESRPHLHLQGSPGSILSYGKGGLLVACGTGALELLRVQLSGKKAVAADEFMRGYPQQSLVFN